MSNLLKTPRTQKPLLERRIGRQITLSNALVQSASSLTTAEKRVIYLACSKFCRNDTVEVICGMPQIMITVADYQFMSGGSARQARKDLLSASLQLFERTILWTISDTTIVTGRARWTSGLLAYQDGSISLEIYPKILPHLLQLSGRFTTLKLIEIRALTGKYAWRLYEIIESHKFRKEVEIDLTELAFQLSLPPSMLGWSNMKLKVLTPAFDEINANTNLIASYTPIKTRRAITSIKITMKDAPNTNISTTKAKTK
jgi:plasmid replication initiation protein